MRWFTKFILFAVLIGGLIYSNMWLRQDKPERADTPAPAQLALQAESAPIQSLVISVLDQKRQAFLCAAGRCKRTPAPSTQSPAITDGTWWYYYEDSDDEAGDTIRYLRRHNPTTSVVEDITESTDLTSPRSLLMSPSGTYVSFFLDNIVSPKEELTELWVYDTNTNNVRLIAEKLYRPDIRSAVRWNAAGTHLWFVGDVGEQEESEDQLELVTISITPPQVNTLFDDTDWQHVLASKGIRVLDLSLTGEQVAYVRSSFLGQIALIVASQDAKEERTTVSGDIPFVQWLEDGTLLYAIQDHNGFTVWQRTANVHRFVARQPGTIRAMKSTDAGDNILFMRSDDDTVYTLTTRSGSIGKAGEIAAQFGHPFIINAIRDEQAIAPQVAAITTELDDGQIAAFIDEHLVQITSDTAASPVRLIITEQPNTVLVDYRTEESEERLLVTIHDAIHPEWSIAARYRAAAGAWQRIEGGSSVEPASLRLYEWEEDLTQWVLKERFD